MNCWFFHKWAKWADISGGTISIREEDGAMRVIGNAVTQERRCERCGKAQRNMIRATVHGVFANYQ